jgi:hypothetical protein
MVDANLYWTQFKISIGGEWRLLFVLLFGGRDIREYSYEENKAPLTIVRNIY